MGLPIYSRLADKRGRRPAFIISSVAGFLSILVSAFMPNIVTYGLARGVVGLHLGGYGLIAFVGPTEWMSSSGGRAFVGTIGLNLGYCMGELLVVCLSATPFWGHGNLAWWRGLTLASAVVAAVVSLPAVLLFKESPRWLLERGDVAAAQALVDAAAFAYDELADKEFSAESAWGGSVFRKLLRAVAWARSRFAPFHAAPLFPRRTDKVSPVLTTPLQTPTQTNKKARTFLDLMKEKRMLLVTAALCSSWFAVAFAYFGLNQAAAKILPGSISVYLKVAVFGLVELPANILAYFSLESDFGRHGTASLSIAVSGICCLILGAISLRGGSYGREVIFEWIESGLGILGKLSVTVGFSTM